MTRLLSDVRRRRRHAIRSFPEEYRILVYLNPAAPLVISWQQLFLTGRLPATLLALAGAYAMIAAVLGSLVFRKLS